MSRIFITFQLKEIFFISSSLICCCYKHLLKSSFVRLYQIYHFSVYAIVSLVSNGRALAERNSLPDHGLLDSSFFSFLSSELNSNTEDYEAPIELVSSHFIYCNFMLISIHDIFSLQSLYRRFSEIVYLFFFQTFTVNT